MIKNKFDRALILKEKIMIKKWEKQGNGNDINKDVSVNRMKIFASE